MNRQKILNDIKSLNIIGKSAKKLYNDISTIVMREITNDKTSDNKRRAYYLSMEYLIGRSFFNNLLELGILADVKNILAEKELDINVFEEIEDAALGNGGLGRLAACFLDSAAFLGLPLNGYGIRYKYGLFKQAFKNGFQTELPDDWQAFGDPWSVRKEAESRQIVFSDFSVTAVPYDYPVIGSGGTINNLRLFQAEGSEEAEKISEYLYPDDSNEQGKLLRIRQEYFFSAAAVGELVDNFTGGNCGKIDDFAAKVTIQLNDTHPVLAIAEFIRILINNYNIEFIKAVKLSREVFNYTNHTIMSEALEKWDASLIERILPEIAGILRKLDAYSREDWAQKGCSKSEIKQMELFGSKRFNMANIAVFVSGYINGVAKLHSEILKTELFSAAYKYYPQRFQNKTNGITQRRWLELCNPELSKFLDGKIGNRWRNNIEELSKLKLCENSETLKEFVNIKALKKAQLAEYIKVKEGISINPSSIFYIQTKRLHEYKRQFMAALGILMIYDKIKDGSIKDFEPSTFIFGAKAAPGYKRAKGIIKFINEIARLINGDKGLCGKLKIVFIQNYNVSYAEKIVSAADVSLQISTAGLEASGTGNMKFMLNGAVTLGTMDGANIEIVQMAGRENNYIFGATVEDIAKIKKSYKPKGVIKNNADIKNAVNYLTDGSLSDNGTNYFNDLYISLTEKTYNSPDNYYVLHDLPQFVSAALKANYDYKDKEGFAAKMLRNTANSAYFSSDRTIKEYAKEIWRI